MKLHLTQQLIIIPTIIAYRITAHKTNSHYKRYLYKLVLSYRRLNILSKMLRHHICIVATYTQYILFRSLYKGFIYLLKYYM